MEENPSMRVCIRTCNVLLVYIVMLPNLTNCFNKEWLILNRYRKKYSRQFTKVRNVYLFITFNSTVH